MLFLKLLFYLVRDLVIANQQFVIELNLIKMSFFLTFLKEEALSKLLIDLQIDLKSYSRAGLHHTTFSQKRCLHRRINAAYYFRIVFSRFGNLGNL